jgi:hypothetical protein
MFRTIIPEGFIRFLAIIVITIICAYLLPPIVATIWYILLLIWYYRSDDEPFWLIFFLITTDGFMGFLGLYVVNIQAIPELPSIELAQFYIILSVFKAARSKKKPHIFYRRYLIILLVYLIFLILWGQVLGYSGEANAYFRLFKLSIPFLLFYSIPRLFTEEDSYSRLFSFVFLVVLLGFFTQLFTLFTGLSPAGTFELSGEQVQEAGDFRAFYNVSATLLGLLGALFYLAQKNQRKFSPLYLNLIVLAAFGMSVISATRGWILSFGITIVIAMILTSAMKIERIIGFIVIAGSLYLVGMSYPKIKEQVQFSTERFMTMESLTTGDITAEGTLKRINVRGPRVMRIWKQSPVFGWGFSDTSRKYQDGHVGNQTLLMTSGIIGFCLLMGFLIYFCIKLLLAYTNKKRSPVYKKAFPVFIVFLIGWFIIHSSSGQQFDYSGIPERIIPQAVFFSFGAFIFSRTK